MNTEMNNKFIEFSLGTQKYGIPMGYIQEVISKKEPSKIPGVPAYYLGIINLRGSIVTLIDLRKKMNITPSQNNENEAIIVLSLNNSLIGLLVDSVNKVLNCTPESLSALPEISNEPNNKYIDSIYKSENSLTALLKVEALFNNIESLNKKNQKTE